MAVRAARNPYLKGRAARVEFTLGTEAANTRKVTVALKGAIKATAPVNRQHARVWLTDSASTLAVTATAPDGAVAVAAKGTIIVSPVAKTVHDVVFDANGEFDLNITHSLAKTWYVNVALGNEVVTSPALAFA
jgi:hypothetical protein